MVGINCSFNRSVYWTVSVQTFHVRTIQKFILELLTVITGIRGAIHNNFLVY